MSTNIAPGTGRQRFWDRPEGTTGRILVGGTTVFVAGALVHVLPALIHLAENVAHLGVLCGAVVGVVLLVTTERPRALVFYAFQTLSRWITSNFVDIDPVAILEAFTRQMRQKREEVAAGIGRVTAVSRTLEREIRRSETELREALRLADAAERQGDEDALNAEAEKAGRRDRNIREYREMHAVVQEIIEALERVRRRVDYHIATSEDETRELVRKHEVARATREATTSAHAVLGDSELLEVRNAAADHIRERYATALGELDALIYVSRDLDKEIDLHQLAFRADGRAKLDELRQRLARAEHQQAAPPPVPPASAEEDWWTRRLRKARG